MEKTEKNNRRGDAKGRNPDHGVIPAGPEAHKNEGQGKQPRDDRRADRSGKKPASGERGKG